MAFSDEQLAEFKGKLLAEMSSRYWLISKEGRLWFWAKVVSLTFSTVIGIVALSGLMSWTIVATLIKDAGYQSVMEDIEENRRVSDDVVKSMRRWQEANTWMTFDSTKDAVVVRKHLIADNNLTVNGGTRLNEDVFVTDKARVTSASVDKLIKDAVDARDKKRHQRLAAIKSASMIDRIAACLASGNSRQLEISFCKPASAPADL